MLDQYPDIGTSLNFMDAPISVDVGTGEGGLLNTKPSYPVLYAADSLSDPVWADLMTTPVVTAILGCMLMLFGAGCNADSVDADPPDHGPPIDSGHSDASWSIPSRPRCEVGYEPPRVGGIPGYAALIETSGIVASLSRPDVLWLHNDSGGEPILYAVGQDGRRRGRLTVPTRPVDWEDIAVARCPDRQSACLWVADVGDNLQSRSEGAVLAIREPVTDGDHTATRVWRFPLRYPDGAINSEALFVAPEGDRFWLVEKVDAATARVFGHPGPLQEDVSAVLTLTATLSSPGINIERGRMITGADLHPSGERLLLRTYTGSFEYLLPEPLAIERLPDIVPRTVAFGPVSEAQGEAIAYDGEGTGVWTISEDPAGLETRPLNHYDCSD